MDNPLDFHCADCGCDRGGVIDLAEKPAVLRCFECAAKPRKEKANVRDNRPDRQRR